MSATLLWEGKKTHLLNHSLGGESQEPGLEGAGRMSSEGCFTKPDMMHLHTEELWGNFVLDVAWKLMPLCQGRFLDLVFYASSCHSFITFP